MLGLTSEQYAGACVASGVKGGRVGALARYSALFREGVVQQAGLQVACGGINRVHDSESHEGMVRKFAQVVGEGVGKR